MIGILYESHEWSDFKLRDELEMLGHQVLMIDMLKEDPVALLPSCSMLVSRVFASAGFRSNHDALARMPQVIRRAEQLGITLINSGRAHDYEIDKQRAANALRKAGIASPHIQYCDYPSEIDPERLEYPCIIKPNCGGRSLYTAVAQSKEDAKDFVRGLPHLVFLVEEFIRPRAGYCIRVELVGQDEIYVYKRSVEETGLSSYRNGSSYERWQRSPHRLLGLARQAARVLDFKLGSFDIIEREGEYYFIDANSVSNVSDDCNELLGIDLMQRYAVRLSHWYQTPTKQVSL